MFWTIAALLAFPWLLGLVISCTMETARKKEKIACVEQ
jgi:hypothetical protein